MAKRRAKRCKETQELVDSRMEQYRAQGELQQRHPADQLEAERQRCRKLLTEGFTTWVDLFGLQ